MPRLQLRSLRMKFSASKPLQDDLDLFGQFSSPSPLHEMGVRFARRTITLRSLVLGK